MLLRLLSGLFRRKALREPPRNITLDPETVRLAESLGRGAVLNEDGKLTAAVQVYIQAAKAHPREAAPQIRAGNVLRRLWRVEEAVEAHTAAFDLSPDSNPLILSAVLFQSHYLAEASPQALYDMHCRYGGLIAEEIPVPTQAMYQADPAPERRLRVGYVSPNFSRHSVGYFIEPVIAHHDHAKYEIFCYYTYREHDDTTGRIEAKSDGWRHVYGMSDEVLAGLIAADRIDVLVDLAGHTSMGRLPVFARRPAPVQVTWLGYPDTTGVAAIDYRVTDAIADPPGAEARHTERLMRIDDLFLCYQPPLDAPAVVLRDSAPAEVVFCSFNALEKLNPPVIALWAKILGEVPGSKLLVKAEMLKHADAERRVREAFAERGVADSRMEFIGWAEDRTAHLALYGRADIALDTFPYNGTTTTCEAMWMGLPVVTLAGETHMSRVGATLLAAVGLNDLVAHTPEAYVAAAVGLARDQARRRALRSGVRARLAASPLLDHAGFTRKLEAGLRAAWRKWCESRST